MEHYKDNQPCAAVEPPGINVEPGSADDGWVNPAAVTLADGSHVQLYKDGEALRAAFDAIRDAKQRICLEVYIFAGDETGQAFAELLMAKAKAGVRVYFIYDSWGSIETDRNIFRRMRQAGVVIQQFNPIRPWECKYSWRPVNRDHRKLLMVDDHIGGMGGLNIANEYAGPWIVKTDRPVSSFWRDTGVGIVGPSARPLLQSFIRSWQYALNGGPVSRAQYTHAIDPAPLPRRRVAQKVTRKKLPTFASENEAATPLQLQDDIGLLASVPTTNSPLRPLINRLIHNAQSSIQMTMAYFAPDDLLVAELCRAAKRGVKVELMLPGCTDVKILMTAARSFYDVLLAAGVKIYERQTVILHAKTIVVDEHISVVGSTNLDYRSIEFNCELSMAVRSTGFAQHMGELFKNDISFAHRIKASAWRRRPVLDRVVQWTVSRARYLL
ncbi:cardiolipin synthase [soil metagenome]